MVAKPHPIFSEVSRSSTRSTLFWWMFENHDSMLAEAAGGRLNWARLCVLFAEAGLTDVTGKPATVRTAKVTWHRARRALQERQRWQVARAAEASPPKAAPPPRLKPRQAPRYSVVVAPETRREPPALVTGLAPFKSSPEDVRPSPVSPELEAQRRARAAVDEQLGLTAEERDRLRKVDEDLDAKLAHLDRKFRLG